MEPRVAAAPPSTGTGESKLSRYLTVLVFLGPAAFMLVVWMVYPAIYTIWKWWAEVRPAARHPGEAQATGTG